MRLAYGKNQRLLVAGLSGSTHLQEGWAKKADDLNSVTGNSISARGLWFSVPLKNSASQLTKVDSLDHTFSGYQILGEL